MNRVLFFAIALTGCGKEKTRCENYADVEAKCSAVSAEAAKNLAKAACEMGDAAGAKASAQYTAEIACALQFKDCDSYQACKAAATTQDSPQ